MKSFSCGVFLESSERPQSAILPFWGMDVKNKVAVRTYKKGSSWGVLVFNDTDQPVTETYQISDLTGEKRRLGFCLGTGI